MTVRELKQLLKGLDNDMIVMMPVGEEMLVTVCKEMSEVVVAKDNDREEEILLLVHCTCHKEVEAADVKENLN